MGRPVWLVENVFNRRIFPGHTISSSNADDDSGWGAAFVGTGRRQAQLNRWESDTVNADAYVQSTFDRVRAFDTIVIDRDCNFLGYPVEVQVSSDGFSNYTTPGSATLPTTVFPFSRLSDEVPIMTEEGAIVWYIGLQAGTGVRLSIPAMGAGIAPQVVGLYAGLRLRFGYPPVKPFRSGGQAELIYQQEQSPQAIVAAGEIGRRQRGSPRYKLADRTEYALVRYHIESLFFSRRPAWFIADDEEAELARLAYAPPGTVGFEVGSDWSEYQGEVPWIEHEPRRVGEPIS